MNDLDALVARAVAAVSADRIVADLASLVAVRSVTGDEAAAAEAVAGMLRAGGPAVGVERWDVDAAAFAADPEHPGSEMPRTALPLVAGVVRTGRPGRRLILSGHTDVVPAGDPATWSTPPFEPVVVDGRLRGRGACDMKGGVVAAVEALRALASLASAAGPGAALPGAALPGAALPDAAVPAALAGEAAFVGVPSEEDGGAGTLAAIRAGWTGDAAIVTEPTRLDVVTASAGAITFRLTVRGRATHASTRLAGVSALEKLEVLHAALRADETRRNAAEADPRMRAIGLPYPTIIGKVQGGDWASSVPDLVVAEGRYGVRLGQDCDGAFAELCDAVAAACDADDWLREHPATVESVGGLFDSVDQAADLPLADDLRAAARAAGEAAPAGVAVPYGSDMRLWARAGGTPCVLYGPGDVRDAHAADESVAIDEVVRCARVLTAWLVRGLAAG